MTPTSETNSDSNSPPQNGETKSFLTKLGPGFITGASDDDPSGIATYSQVGAQFGYGMLWTLLFSYPLMCAIQEISGRLGRVTGRGLAGNLRRYPAWLMYSLITLLVLANIINIGADIASMGAGTKLLIGGPSLLYASLFALLCLLLQIFVSYKRYADILKWLSLVLLSYIVTAFVVHASWSDVFHNAISPSLSFNVKSITALIAVLGTTISPYLFFWQSSQEVEEVKANEGEEPLRRAPHQAAEHFQRIRLDTLAGMLVSNVVAFFIMLTCAASLHENGKTQIDTAAQAAEALRPFAGHFAFLLFAGGLVGTGLLSVPVLAGSAAYAVGEALHWPTGLERKPLEAKGFYGVLAAATLLGLALDFTGINPIKALFWSAVINGVVAGPVMGMMMLMASNPRVMTEEFTLSRGLKFMGWLATAVMLLAAIAMFATWGKS